MPGKYKTLILHGGGWIVYLLILILGAARLDRDFLINTTGSLIPVIILFYLNTSLLIPSYLPGRKILPLISWLILLDFFTILLRLVIVMAVQKTGYRDLLGAMLSPIMFWNQFRVNLLFIGISFAYWYAQRNYKVEKDRQRLEKEILDARLSLLKNQINPHFLHNTLSFLYTKSLPYSAELAGAILQLSDMMRYSLGEAEENGKVSLEKEVEHLENFIRIHQLRFDNTLKVNFTKQGDFSRCHIMPLLLITFVENAFKHGKLTDANHPLTIRLCADDAQIIFYIENKKNNDIKQRSGGIGLVNIRNRLELSYPGRYEFIIGNKTEAFIVNLKLSADI